eukprot:356547-Chlamydomonas_euryale.AAC.4
MPFRTVRDRKSEWRLTSDVGWNTSRSTLRTVWRGAAEHAAFRKHAACGLHPSVCSTLRGPEAKGD